MFFSEVANEMIHFIMRFILIYIDHSVDLGFQKFCGYLQLFTEVF